MTDTSPTGAESCFRFELTEDFNVQVTSLHADYNLYLYDADGGLAGGL